MPDRVTFAETEQMLQGVASGLDKIFGNKPGDKNIGFCLLVFPFGGPEGARTNYVSNAERADIIAMLKEITARFEGSPMQSGRA